MLGLATNRLDSIKAAALTEYINQAVRKGWHFEWFPEWLLTERRYYRATWATGTSYGAPTATTPVEVYHIRSGRYVQSLHSANQGNEPFDTSDEENSAHWAECADSYEGDDYEAGAYSVGDIVRNPDDDRYYQCHTAHTGTSTFDSTKFGILTPFSRYVAYEQTGQTAISRVKQASSRDPRVFSTTPGLLKFQRTNLGIQLSPLAPDAVYLQFQEQPPVFTSTPWEASTAYVVGDLVYTSGETYICITNHTSSSSFAVGSNWELVEMPWVLAEFCKRFARSQNLNDLKLLNRALAEEGRAEGILAELWEEEFAGQDQYSRAVVQTYGS
jgi:hypothetical protein